MEPNINIISGSLKMVLVYIRIVQTSGSQALECIRNPLEGLIKHGFLSPTCSISDLVGLCWS